MHMLLPYLPLPAVHAALHTRVLGGATLGGVAMWCLVTPVQFLAGGRFLVNGWRSARRCSAGMDLLVALATCLAYFYSLATLLLSAASDSFQGGSFFETSAMLITFVVLGKYLEAVAKGKTSQAVAELAQLQPQVRVRCRRRLRA